MQTEGTSNVNPDERVRASVALSVLCAVAFVWLSTLDVDVDERNVNGAPAFCGSAYDVALLKRDGYMGGEVPVNQTAIDRVCVREAERDIAIAGLAGVLGACSAGYALRLRRMRHSGAGDPTGRRRR